MQIAAELEKVGIKVNIQILPWSEFVEKMYADPVEGYDMILHGWGADYNDSSNIISLWATSEVGGGLNHSGYTDPEFEEYYQSALHSPSYDEAGEFYFKAAQKINEDVPSYCLGHCKSYIATSQSILNGEGLLGGWGNYAHYWMIKKAQ